MRAILTYHSIDSSGSPISVSPEAFRAHCRWLARGPVRVVPLAALLAMPETEDAVALTFDDGYSNFAAEAAPLLEAYGLPATLFVVPGQVGKTNAWGGRAEPRIPTLSLLDWPALAGLAERGIRLGAHSRTHPRLSAVPASQLEDELAGAAETIRQETGQSPEDLAYPFGDVTPAVARAAARVYRRAVTTEFRPLAPNDDPLRLPRLDAYYFRGQGQLEAWGTPRFRQRLWFRGQARKLRQRLTGGGPA